MGWIWSEVDVISDKNDLVIGHVQRLPHTSRGS